MAEFMGKEVVVAQTAVVQAAADLDVSRGVGAARKAVVTPANIGEDRIVGGKPDGCIANPFDDFGQARHHRECRRLRYLGGGKK
jgi:hypothetical protein